MKKLFLSLFLLLFVAVGSFAKTYKVTASKLNVRNAPDKSGSVVGSVTQDTEVEVLEIVDGWARIKYNGKTAYISAQYLTPVKSSSSTGQSSKSQSSSSSSSSQSSGSGKSSGKADKPTSTIEKPMIGGFHMTWNMLFTGRSVWYRESRIDPKTNQEMGLWDYYKLGRDGYSIFGFSIGLGFEYNHVIYRTSKANLMIGFRTGIDYDWSGSLARKLSTPASEGWMPDDYQRSRISVHSLTIPLQPVFSFEWPVGRKTMGFGIFTGPIFETFFAVDYIQLAFQNAELSMLISNGVSGKVAYLIGGNGSGYQIPEAQRMGVFNCLWGTGAFFQMGRFRLTVSTDWGIHNYDWVRGSNTVTHVDARWNRFITAGFQIVML